MQTHSRPRAAPVERQRRKDEQPTTYPKGRRCGRCACFLNIYNEGPLCHPCQPGGEGVDLEVAPGEWRRFKTVELLRDDKHNDELRAEDFAELMSEEA